MTASTSAHSINAYRYAWEAYANQVVSEIYAMSDAERIQSIAQLRLKCTSMNVPPEEAKAIFEYPGKMTEKELKLRAKLQVLFDQISPDVLQSHFTYFYQKGQTIAQLRAEVVFKANKVIVDELGKSLLRKGIQPKVPPHAPQ